MTTSVVYGIAGDGYVWSAEADDAGGYAAARAGANLLAVTADVGNIIAGQEHYADYYGDESNVEGRGCYEGFPGFDTSVVSTDTVSSAVASYYLLTDSSTTDFTVQMRVKVWSAGGLTTADWIAGASLTGQTLVAHKATSGIGAAGYKAFTDDALAANINGAGNSEFILHSDRHSGNNTPTGAEFVAWQDADYTGTTQDPYLTIVHTAGGGGATLAPAAGSVVVTGGTPTVAVSDHKTVAPSGAAAAVTGGTPTVAVTQNVTLSPAAASVGVTGGNNTLGVSDHKTMAPAAASVSVTGDTPTLAVSDHKTLSPAAATVSVTGGANTVLTPVVVSPMAATVTVTGDTPVCGTSQTLAPGAAALTVTGSAATVVVSAGIVVAPASAAVVVTGESVSLAATANVTLMPAGATIIVTPALVILIGAAPVIIIRREHSSGAVSGTTGLVGSATGARGTSGSATGRTEKH